MAALQNWQWCRPLGGCEYRQVAISGGTGTAPDPGGPKESTMAQQQRPTWENVAISKAKDADFLARHDTWKKEFAEHLVATGRIEAAPAGFRVVIATNKMARDGIVSWTYIALPKDKEPSEKERLQRELEEARLELERLRAEAAKPRLVKARA
jgi:hypothetical protein